MLERVIAGDRRALARLLTWIENDDPAAAPILAGLYPHTGRAHRVGVTGAPGTGKSTLVTGLARAYRARGATVGVIAVDPTSPFTGGAILGDRVRMRDLAGDAGIFIRSMATRGSLGGLARATRDVARALDAAGFDAILIETVGAGQSEVDIARMAQSVIVVDAPGMGDEVQAIKAGILEIADILVVNKADRAGADKTAQALRMMVELGHGDTGWLPPVLLTVASAGTGIDAVIAALDAHHAHLATTGAGARLGRVQVEIELRERLRERLLADCMARLGADGIAAEIARVEGGEIDPRAAVEAILARAYGMVGETAQADAAETGRGR
jgi:LAO/AO transport system kinase